MKVVRVSSPGFEFTCRKCKSVLVAEADDVLVGYFGANYGGDTPSREYYVTCAVCGTIRILKYHELTPNMRAAADKKERRRR